MRSAGAGRGRAWASAVRGAGAGPGRAGASAVRGAGAGPGRVGTPATGVVLGRGATPRRRAGGRVGWVRKDEILGLYS